MQLFLCVNFQKGIIQLIKSSVTYVPVIARNDFAGLLAACATAKQDYPEIFVRHMKSNGYSIKLDAEGNRLSEDREPVLPIKTLWILPKEKKCHRCDYEFVDVPKEPKAKVCPKCMAKYEGIDISSTLPGINPGERDSATTEVAKTFYDQAKALVGTAPIRFSAWIDEDGLKVIACELERLSPAVVVVSEKKKYVRVGGVRRTTIDPKKISLRNILLGAMKSPDVRPEYHPEFLPCQSPVVPTH